MKLHTTALEKYAWNRLYVKEMDTLAFLKSFQEELHCIP